MAYATRRELIDRLTDAVATSLSASDAVIDEALAGADGEVNSYLAGRYRVPVDAGHTQAASLLRTATLNLAEWQLWTRRGREIPPRIQDARQASIGWLRDLAAGRAVLPAATTIAAATVNAPAASIAGSSSVMTQSSMDGW